MVIVPYIRHNAVHTAQCRMPYEICHTGARILSINSHLTGGRFRYFSVSPQTKRKVLYRWSIRHPTRSFGWKQIEDCSGRSTQVPFWRKWVIDGFKVVLGQKIFWQYFGRFGPFPVGVTQGSSGGQIFKMLQMTFHVYQITREVIRITKIYSLLCVGAWLGRY